MIPVTIGTLLLKLPGEIVAGPSALGLYQVAVPRVRADAAEASFGAADGVVESAQCGP